MCYHALFRWHYRKFVDCGHSIRYEHTFTNWEYCTEFNHQSHCTECNYWHFEEHEFEENYADDGIAYTQTCKVCGYVDCIKHLFSGEYCNENADEHSEKCLTCGEIIKSLHIFGDIISNGNKHYRECEEYGYKDYSDCTVNTWESNGDDTHKGYCTECNGVVLQNHEFEYYNDSDDATHAKRCKYCGLVVSEKHNIKWTPCEDDKTHDGHCDCFLDETYTINNQPHNYSDWENITDDIEVRVCKDCGYEETRNVLPLLGDVNDDNSVNVADAVLLQKWLLAVPNTTLPVWQNADIWQDGKIDIFDLCLMKKLLIKQND